MTRYHLAPFYLPPLPAAPAAAPEVCPDAPEVVPGNADPLTIDPSVPVSTWAAERLGFQADDFQKELLDAHTHRLALCCSRQTGKSTVAAVKALHFAAANPGSLILLAAPTSRQSGELLRTFRAFAERLLNARVKSDPGTKDSILLPNGSRIIALPQSPNHVRGYANAALIIVDEAAFVADDMFRALSPMQAVSNGQRWYISTANACKGEFYEVFTGKDPAWTRLKRTADQCPRISADFLAAERLALGQVDFDREYMCVFSTGREQFIPEAAILAAVVDDPYKHLRPPEKK
jgi:hypothetical protein